MSGSSRDLNPMPLSAGQCATLVSAGTRALKWTQPLLDRELDERAAFAARIPAPTIRADALRSFSHKRGHIAGASLFSVLSPSRDEDLLRALIAYEMIADFLDDVHERHPTEANGRQLHQAVVDAFDPGTTSDYFNRHPERDDGGYLRSLVETCQASCQALPSFDAVRPYLMREAVRARDALTLNHLPVAAERDSALRAWAETEFPAEKEWRWYELSAAASGQLTFFALMAAAAKPHLGEDELADTHAAYWPLMPLLTAMLDSFADQNEDMASGKHSYLAHYPEADGIERLEALIRRAGRGLVALPGGHRHAAILSMMITFYLAKESVRAPAMKSDTKRLLRAGGSLPRALGPIVLRWRASHAQEAV